MKINLEKYIYNPSSFFSAKTLVALFSECWYRRKYGLKCCPGKSQKEKWKMAGRMIGSLCGWRVNLIF